VRGSVKLGCIEHMIACAGLIIVFLLVGLTIPLRGGAR
jgi:hypothetical protein